MLASVNDSCVLQQVGPSARCFMSIVVLAVQAWAAWVAWALPWVAWAAAWGPAWVAWEVRCIDCSVGSQPAYCFSLRPLCQLVLAMPAVWKSRLHGP